VIALGPLTNLALAIRLNAKVAGYPKELFILGGNHEGEFNFNSVGEKT